MGLRYDVDGHVATITLDMPERLNAIDLDSWQALSDATRRLEDDPDTWVGIITATGERAFCAGADVSTTIEKLMDDPRGKPWAEPDTIMRGQQVTKPLIAAVNGVALGGGLEIMLACDIRIAAPHARFGLPEVSLGLIPGWGGTQRLIRQIPWSQAMGMILTGDMLSADDALACGLINKVVPFQELAAEVRALADHLCERGPLALQAAKRAAIEGSALPLADGLALERQLFQGLTYTYDAEEGVRSFAERRKPSFSGS